MPRQKSVFRLVAEPLILAVVLAFVVRASVRLFSIPSESMAPALQIGDRIVVTPYRFSDPGRGDVIVFHAPANPDELVVKRIVALPGDVIETKGGQVRVGGRTFPEPYLARPASTGTINALIVPADCYFVMGDNRDRSYDSRHWGPLPRDLVIGRARLILWSSPPTIYDAPVKASTLQDAKAPSSRTRFSRIFKWIE